MKKFNVTFAPKNDIKHGISILVESNGQEKAIKTASKKFFKSKKYSLDDYEVTCEQLTDDDFDEF